MKDQYCIGELSKHFNISTDTLRLYDKAGILPSRRAQNGYRYYSREDMICLGYILRLRRSHMPLSKIEPLIHDRSLVSAEELMQENKKRIEHEITELQALARTNETMLRDVQETISCLGTIRLAMAPRMIYWRMNHSLNDAERAFSCIHGFSDPKMAFLVPQARAASPEYESALVRAKASEFGTELVLMVEDHTGELPVPEDCDLHVIPPRMSLIAGIQCETGHNYSSHVRVLRYAAEHNYRINGEVVWLPALHVPVPSAPTDYYRLIIPVETNQ